MKEIIQGTIKRAKHDKEHPYVQISRALIRDKSISPKAKGVLIYLLSLPDNWVVHHKHVAVELNVGREYLSSAFKELVNAGYCRVTQTRNDTGTFATMDYEYSEEPEFKEQNDGLNKILPQTALPLTALPFTGNPHLRRRDIKEEDKEKEICAAESGSIVSPVLEKSPKILRKEFVPIDDKQVAAIGKYGIQIFHVMTTEKEHLSLVEKHGLQLVEECYAYLAEWKQTAPIKTVVAHSSDSYRIKKWVITAIRDLRLKERELTQRETRLNTKTSPRANSRLRCEADDRVDDFDINDNIYTKFLVQK